MMHWNAYRCRIFQVQGGTVYFTSTIVAMIVLSMYSGAPCEVLHCTSTQYWPQNPHTANGTEWVSSKFRRREVLSPT